MLLLCTLVSPGSRSVRAICSPRYVVKRVLSVYAKIKVSIYGIAAIVVVFCHPVNRVAVAFYGANGRGEMRLVPETSATQFKPSSDDIMISSPSRTACKFDSTRCSCMSPGHTASYSYMNNLLCQS